MPASARRNAASARRGGVRAWLFAATLAACLASASPRSTQESLGFGAKSAAAIPSYAVSGEPAVLAVHGLNFAPGGAHPTSSPSLARGLRAPRLAAFSTFSTSLSLSLAHELTHALTHALTPFPRSRSPSVATASAGSSCQRCSLPEGHALCRFDARGPHALTFPSGGAGDVARCAVDPTRAGFGSPKGFAGVGLSDNAGSDWADVTFGEHAVVNFAEPSATSRALRGGGGPPAGLPVHLSGANFGGSRRTEADGGNRPPLACAFDGRAAPTALDENGGVSAALHRCETPPRADATVTRRTAAVLPPGAVLPAGDGTGGTLEGARAVWTDTPWTRAGAVTVNKRALRFESGARFRETPSADDGARRAEDGGDAFVAALVLEDAHDRSFFFTTGTSKGQMKTNAYPPTRSIDESPKHWRVTEGDFADVLSSVGCAFGATRVAARADGDGERGAVFCVSPAARPAGSRSRSRSRSAAFFGVGARFAERMTVEVRCCNKNAPHGRAEDDGALFGAVVGRRGTLDVSSAAGDVSSAACAIAVGTETGWVQSGGSQSFRLSLQRVSGVFPLFCDTPLVAAEHAGFIAVRVALGRSLGQISARAAPAARSAAPAATAAGGASVNVPVFVTGKDLPGFGESAWCVSRGGAFDTASAEEDVSEKTKKSAAFVPATAVSSALVACPPPEFPYGARSGDFSSSPARLEIVPADVAAGAPTGGAFYAKSSVELDVEAHGEAAPGAAGAMAVGGGGGGGGAGAAALLLTVPEEGGATVFVRPGGARVAPSGCDFGTIAGVAARHAHAHAEERPPGGEEETWGPSSGSLLGEPAKNGGWFACVSPAMRARRAVPTRAAFPSRSRRDADDVGHVVVRRLDRRLEDERSLDRAFVDDPTKPRDVRGGATRGARLALPAATTYHGGSPASVALGASVGGGVGVPFFCVFAADAAAGFEARRVVVRVAAVLSATLVRCETPPPFEWAPPRRPPDVARGAVEAASAAEAFRETSPTTKNANADAAVFAWVAPPALESAAPRSGPAEGGVLVSLFGSGLNGGARPAAWFGAVGPVACRVAGDADAASDAAAEKTKRFVFLSCVSPASAPTRAFAGGTPAPLAASATGDAQTRSAFGFGVTYAALHTGTRGVSGLKTSPGDVLSRRGHGAAAAAKRRETPETRVVVAPAAAPVGGGAVLWLYGSGFRNGVTEPPRFEPSAGFAFVSLDEGDDGRYGGRAPSTRVGACVPVSSALAACEAPSLAFPTRRARARFVPFAEGTIVEGFVEGVAYGLDGASLAVAAPTSVSRVAPEAVSAGGGASVLARLSAPAAASARLGCVFGSVGPVAGRFAAEARDTLSCVAPAHAPSLSASRGARTLVPVAVTGAGSGAAFAWADAGAFPGDAPGVAYVGGDAADGAARSPRAFVLPSAVATHAPADVRVFGAGAHFLRAAAGAGAYRDDGVASASAACLVGVGAERGGDADFGISCVFGSGALTRPGFRAVWVTWGTNDDGHGHGTESLLPSASFGPFELLISAPPRVFAAYPAETTAFGGGVAFATGSGFRGDHGVLAIVFGASGSSLAGSGSRNVVRTTTLVDVVSSALARVETPDFFAAGVDAVTGDDGRARVAAGFGFSGFSVSGSRSETFRDVAPNAGPELGSHDHAPTTSSRTAPTRTTNDNDDAGAILVSRRRPIAYGADGVSSHTSPLSTLSPAGGAIVSLAGDALRSAVGNQCACFFGTVGPVAAVCGSTSAQCAAPATRPRRVLPVALLAGAGGSHLFARRPPGAAASVALDAAGSGAAVTAVAVGGAGAAEGALLGGSGGSGAMVYGWGLDALEAVDHQHVYASAHTHVSQAPAPVARAPRAVAACVFDFEIVASVKNDEERSNNRIPGLPASGFVYCGVELGALSRLTAFVVVRVAAPGEPFAVGDASTRATQIATRPRAVATSSAPARSPAAGGGVLWVSGSDLRDAADGASQAESGPSHFVIGVEGLGSSARASCVAVDKSGQNFFGGGFAGARHAVSSALVACEIPPARAFTSDDGSMDVSIDRRVAYVEGGDLESGSFQSHARVAANPQISPARGSVAGGTPVRVAAARAHPGWGAAGGDAARDAGCFFGPTAVRARWATATEVECVTPSRGVTAAAVRVAPVMDHRTRSFIAFGETYATFKYAMF